MAKKTIRPYQIKQGDSLHSIARDTMGDAAKWYEVAIFNNLTYPYIDEGGRTLGQKASGVVVFYVDAPIGVAVTIPEGVVVTTEAKAGWGAVSEYSKKFQTLAEVVLGAQALSVQANIEALGYGDIGNVAEGEVTEIVRQGTGTGLNVNVKVINAGLITGGQGGKVLTIGDVILIPDLEGRLSNEFPVRSTYLDVLLGTDLYLGGEGTNKPKDVRAELTAIYDKDFSVGASETINSFGGQDLLPVSGIENLIQALMHRMVTDKGELPYHPEYGSLLPTLVGRPGTGKNIRLLETEAIATCLEDARVDEVLSLSMTALGQGAYSVEFTVRPIGMNSVVNGNFIADFRA